MVHKLNYRHVFVILRGVVHYHCYPKVLGGCDCDIACGLYLDLRLYLFQIGIYYRYLLSLMLFIALNVFEGRIMYLKRYARNSRLVVPVPRLWLGAALTTRSPICSSSHLIPLNKRMYESNLLAMSYLLFTFPVYLAHFGL